MRIQQTITEKIQSLNPKPSVISVENESSKHAVPINSETHFKVVIVWQGFEGKRRVQRHQQIYALLSNELANGVHALALNLYAPNEWEGESPQTPDCLGGER